MSHAAQKWTYLALPRRAQCRLGVSLAAKRQSSLASEMRSPALAPSVGRAPIPQEPPLPAPPPAAHATPPSHARLPQGSPAAAHGTELARAPPTSLGS
eukprot:CAMPEP_0181213126 /NCGR_PEP_ID=MMETSP1096-20121128/24732_1 /TAXON_ID=156174 ORGANISM="Chrysochromulina ericina, Strain CCMP281" /NCGR_SAMPLE_ID=MMETSP1096 /ASSEMBLY_ACC=CAM_ASM_000453 /LENGTH=97 /DNA_ID=CAMNT_0023304731 /DNA_START=246 /DNA_END=539 /DNA_ORIENTATION=+